MSQPRSFGKRRKPETVVANKPTVQKSYLEHRKNLERATQLKKIVMTYNNGFSVSSGILRNLSSNGARIETDSLATIPDEFTLEGHLADFKLKCRKVWRSANMVGVEFIE